ncbi:MAG: CHAT domain-containing tetratricopeptide repeat protein [Bacteroidota bacterium]
MRTSLLLTLSLLSFRLLFAQEDPLPPQHLASYQRALLTARLGNHNNALTALKKLFTEAPLSADWQERLAADTLFLHGVIDYEKRSMVSAEQYLKAALAAREAMFGQTDSAVAETHSRLGMLYRRTGDYEQSEQYMQSALEIQRQVLGPQDVIVAYSLNNLGNLYKSRNIPQKAIEHYDAALAIYQTLEKDSLRLDGEGMTYLNYGILNHRMGDYALAEQQVLHGLTDFKALYGPMAKELGSFWFELARLAIDQSDFSQSLIYADSASKAWEGENVPENLYLKIVKGIAHAERGDYEQAEAYQLLVLNEMQARGISDPNVIGGIYSNLANIALLQDKLEEAKAYIKKGMELKASAFPSGDPVLRNAYYLLGQINHKKGNYQEAIPQYEQALLNPLGRKKNEVPENGATYETLGALYSEIGEYDKAFANFDLARQCFESADLTYHVDYARVYEKMGHAYSKSGQFAEAKAALKQGREILGYDFEIENNPSLPPLKSPYTRNALLENLQASAKVYLAEASSQSEEPEFAWQSLQLAVALIDSMRLSFRSHGAKALLHEKIFPVYDAAISLAWTNYQSSKASYWLEQAFQLSERNKSMILFESLRDHQARRFGGIPDSILQKERRISLDLALVEKELFELESKADEGSNAKRAQLLELRATYDAFISQLENDYPAYFNLKYAPNSVAVADIQAQLAGQSQAWISYFVGESQTYAFVIQAKGATWMDLGESQTLSKQIEALTLAIQEDELQPEVTLAQLSHQLYTELVHPLGKLPLELVIIPDGILGYVPFDLLLREAPQNKESFKNWAYLLLDHQLSYAYSGTLHLKQVQRENRPKLQTKVLAFAPSFPKLESVQYASSRRQLAPLAHNQSEVNQLSRYFASQTFFDSQASEAEFKQNAPSYDIIHIASHALVNDKNPLYSHINFTPGADSLEDGILELAELFNLRLEAEMVVLSACETGLGKLQQGEGIVSLARGMSYAGANSVLTTLWQVNDAATADIMQRFYAELDQGKSKDAALRNAKLAYLKASDQIAAHPFYWAAYVPIGDMRPLPQSKLLLIIIGFGLGIALLGGVYWYLKRK